MHYYQFNIGDYASHTQHLDEIEDLAYRRMIDYCYLNEIGLPESVEEVARVVRMRTHCDRIANVLREFFVQQDDGWWRHKRIESDIQAFKEKSGKASEAARKRWEKPMRTHSERNADAMLTNNHKPITNNQETETKKKPPATAKAAAVSLPDYMKAKKEAGEKVIPEDDPVITYADSVGIPPEYLRICWREFVDQYSDGLKKYKDWRSVFRKAVRGNWFKLWWIDDQGSYQLTTTGRQALMAHKESNNG